MRILVCDDELSMREYLDVLLTQAGYEVICSRDADEAIQALQKEPFDLVISDIKLGKQSGMTVLRAARAANRPPEVILITAFGSPAAAVEAMRQGAYDYICKPFDNEELKLLVQKALEKGQLLQENQSLKRSLGEGGSALWVGRTQAMREIWSVVEKVASSRSTVLITGESGTGKEVIAKAIHLKSPRAGQPWIPVNCAALAEGVLESELFGHVKGSFTGATADRKGLLLAAGEGAVFLDEIGEVPLSTQVKLLRVLQEKKVKPVGSSQEVPFHARILCATNKRLEAEVKAGRFREDLYYRLNVIAIEVPPLRQRKQDIAPLAAFFLERLSAELDRPRLRFSDEALAVLEGFSFPGNVRQLENIVERAATLSEGEVLGLDTLPPALTGTKELGPDDGKAALPEGFSLERFLDQSERKYLLAALDRSGGVKTKAADLLGLSFRSFRYRLAKHGLSDLPD